jgi:hypothetical protein
MKPRQIHIMAVRLGDHIPVLNGRLVAVRDTPFYRHFTVEKPDGSRVTRRRRNNQQIYIHDK